MDTETTIVLTRGNWVEVVRDYPLQSLDDLADIASANFKRRFGYPPDKIYEDFRQHLWLGPIREDGGQDGH